MKQYETYINILIWSNLCSIFCVPSSFHIHRSPDSTCLRRGRCSHQHHLNRTLKHSLCSWSRRKRSPHTMMMNEHNTHDNCSMQVSHFAAQAFACVCLWSRSTCRICLSRFRLFLLFSLLPLLVANKFKGGKEGPSRRLSLKAPTHLNFFPPIFWTSLSYTCSNSKNAFFSLQMLFLLLFCSLLFSLLDGLAGMGCKSRNKAIRFKQILSATRKMCLYQNNAMFFANGKESKQKQCERHCEKRKARTNEAEFGGHRSWYCRTVDDGPQNSRLHLGTARCIAILAVEASPRVNGKLLQTNQW